MFSRKKKPPPAKTSSRQRNPMDFGIPGIPGFDPTIQDDDDDDLEAELLALTGGRKKKAADTEADGGDDDDDLEAELARIIGGSSKKKTRPVRTVPLVQTANISSLGDVDEGCGSDDDVDENDPNLLQELSILTGEGEDDSDEAEATIENDEEEEIPSQREIIIMRLEAYKVAESNAKAKNESARARRFNRGVKTLENLLKRAEAGEVIPNSDIPPDVSRPTITQEPQRTSNPPEVPSSPTERTKNNEENEKAKTEQNLDPIPLCDRVEYLDVWPGDPEPSNKNQARVPTPPIANVPSTPSPIKETDNTVNSELQLLLTRSVEYKKAALAAKNAGNKAAALQNVRTVKAIDLLLNRAKNREKIPESQIPPPPSYGTKERPSTKLTSASPASQRELSWMGTEIFSVPTTVTESLSQRLNYYTKAVKTAEMKGLRVEATRCREVVKAYQNAILQHRNQALVHFEKLPTPPGCPPIPISFQI